jgi:CheY-like chemotaxis protein
LKNIFSKFSQEDVSTFRKYGGSGLGMSITKELIQLMNGSIEIKSEKNEGTTVLMKFIIPLGDSSKLLKEEIATNSKNIDCIEVLLVEDNEFNRLVAGNTLAHYNCNVTEAVNGLEAIKILKTGKKFDIILMDLQMPIMDGFECTKIIRDELNIDMPIIALTANAFKSKLEKCLNIGMNDCIVKPFEEDKLMNSIYKLIQNNSKVTIKKHTENIVIEKKMYNLIRLNDMSRDNSVYFRKMILIFIEQSTISISQINDAYLIKDFDSLYSVSHRIKPSIDIMGIEVLKKPIRYIEKHSMNHKETVQFKKQIELLTTTLSKVINQLKSEL